MQLPHLNLPPAGLTVREEQGKPVIFDTFRRRYIALTPEEWVRQHFLHWLVHSMAYPKGLISVEVALRYGRLNKRADAMVYANTGKPLMIIECKAPAVQIGQDVFDQVARYNAAFGVDFLAVTNGMQHFCCKIDRSTGQWSFLQAFPTYEALKTDE